MHERLQHIFTFRIDGFSYQGEVYYLYTVKTNLIVLDIPTPVLGKQEASVIWLFSEIKLTTTTSIKRSRRELSIDMVIYRGTFKDNRNTLLPNFTFIPKTEVFFLSNQRNQLFRRQISSII